MTSSRVGQRDRLSAYTLKLPIDTWQRFKAIAALRGTTIGALIRTLVEAELERARKS